MIYSHYSQLMAECFERFRPDPDEGQLEFLQLYLRRDAPNLELACGTGRLIYPIRQLGYDIYGIDSSPEMLAGCDARSSRHGFSVPVSVQFMQNFSIDISFGLIFIADCSWDLLYTVEDQRRTLQTIIRHLQPGGTLLFNTEVPPDPADMASGHYKDWSTDEGGRVIVIHEKFWKYNPETFERPGIQLHELYMDGELVKKQAYYDPMRYNDPQALVRLLQEEGLEDVRVTADNSEGPLEPDAEVAMLRCRKCSR